MKHLSELAKAEIQELEEKGLMLTLDQKIWINDLCRKVENPEGSQPCMAIGEPIPAGCTWLWPFTVQAHMWYERVGEWFENDDRANLFCMAYALAHGRDVGAFTYLNDFKTVKSSVMEWGRKLNCSYDELTNAITAVLGSDDVVVAVDDDSDEESIERSVNYDDIIAWLVTKVGQTPEFWTVFVSRDYLFKQVHAIHKQEAAQAGEPDPNDPYIIAMKNLGTALIQIKKDIENG